MPEHEKEQGKESSSDKGWIFRDWLSRCQVPTSFSKVLLDDNNRSFRNECELKSIDSYHFCNQRVGNDGRATGLMNPGLYHRAIYFFLSFPHKKTLGYGYESGKFKLRQLLNATGITGVL